MGGEVQYKIPSSEGRRDVMPDLVSEMMPECWGKKKVVKMMILMMWMKMRERA